MLIILSKDKEIKLVQDLKALIVNTIVYSHGSNIDGRNTATEAWCENNKHFHAFHLDEEIKYRIFEA